MAIDDKIRNGKLPSDINKEAAKILALSSDKVSTINMNILQANKYYHMIKVE